MQSSVRKPAFARPAGRDAAPIDASRGRLLPGIPAPPLSEARALVASARLFQELPLPVLGEVAGQLEWNVVPGGGTLCEEGEAGERLYLVACGRLIASWRRPEGEIALGEIGRGESVGEVAVVTGRPRAATVRAVRDTIVASLGREELADLADRQPSVLRQLVHVMAARLDERPRAGATPHGLSFALVGAGAAMALDEVTAGLAAALAALGSTVVLDAYLVEALFGSGAAASPDGSSLHGRVTRWLAEQEAAHRFVVYRADTGGAWARRCLRQADRVLVVAAAGEPPLAAALAVVRDQPERAHDELVLVHPAATERPSESAHWLALHPFRAHHHLRRGEPAGLERLARQVSGQGVGLVLGGGGVRGFAHIGVIRALEEAGVPIDRIGGASMGGIIAAQHAYGYGWREMLEINRRGWIGMRPHKAYTLPLVSLLSKGRGERMLEMMFGGAHIEDLPTPFFCVSTNLTRTEVVVHRSGPLQRALTASMTIPGLSPPIVTPEGELLVDGGVLNSLPIDVMRRLGDGPIVASDVSATVDLRADPSWDDAPTPWQLLRGRLRRGAAPRPFPNILSLVARSALLASDLYAKHAKGEVELYLDLPMEPFSMFDVERLDELVDYGYRFTRRALATAPGVSALRGAAAATPPPAL